MKPRIKAGTGSGISLSVGVSGSGKTFGIKQQVYRAVMSGMFVVVIDRLHEWRVVPRAIADRTAVFDCVREAIVKKPDSGGNLALVRSRDMELDAETVCQWAMRAGNAGVAISEAHRVLPNRAVLPRGALGDVLTSGRHRNIRLWLDTQRLALLSKTATEQAANVRVYTIVGDRDKSVLKTTWGTALLAAVEECGAKLARGEAGWHVRLGPSRLGPYRPTRKVF